MKKVFLTLAVAAFALLGVPAEQAKAGVYFGFSDGNVNFRIGSTRGYRTGYRHRHYGSRYRRYNRYNRYSSRSCNSYPRYRWVRVGYRSCGQPIYRRVRVY